eukprot:scaffold98_cov172-Amphora_coffeaeformis.AAC.20
MKRPSSSLVVSLLTPPCRNFVRLWMRRLKVLHCTRQVSLGETYRVHEVNDKEQGETSCANGDRYSSWGADIAWEADDTARVVDALDVNVFISNDSSVAQKLLEGCHGCKQQSASKEEKRFGILVEKRSLACFMRTCQADCSLTRFVVSKQRVRVGLQTNAISISLLSSLTTDWMDQSKASQIVR